MSIFKIDITESLKLLKDIKLNHFILVAVFINSLVLWFLNIYFFAPEFFKEQPLVITLLVTFVLTFTWLAISILAGIKNEYIYLVELSKEFNLTENAVIIAFSKMIAWYNLFIHLLFTVIQYFGRFHFVHFIIAQFAIFYIINLIMEIWLGKTMQKHK